MNMSEQLPGLPIGSTITEKRVVVQIDSLFANGYQHLHLNIQKSMHKALTYVIHIMIPQYQNNPAMEIVKQTSPLCSTTHREVTKMKHEVILSHNSIPVLDHHAIHLLNIHKRTLTESDDVLMAEMRIGCEPDFFVFANLDDSSLCFHSLYCVCFTLQRYEKIQGKTKKKRSMVRNHAPEV